ncbi:MAG TPA: hypothetical protein VMN57_02630 [Anaerolineales bacterium]|nr:hypothetical protein [Anaerolineales bacterium]
MRILIRPIGLLSLLLLVLSAPTTALAQACTLQNWGETRTRSFIFTYQEATPLGREIAERFGEALDAEFNRFANLFETSPPVPLMVRVYPNEREYYCFNALAPEIPIGQTHSRIGGREIALIAQNISADPQAWEAGGLEALRHELAVLFLNALTAEKAPPGLQLGLGIYAEDPSVTFESRLADTRPPTTAPEATWRTLWEAPNVVFERSNALQAASITAYLVDVYGWDDFLEFAAALRTADSWRLALEAVYPIDANALERHWAETYYPVYLQGRWRENAFYALSLAPYEGLIAAGAYQAAADGLANVITVLIDMEEFDQLSRAQELNVQAHQGLEADALARQARQAYLEGDFTAAADFARESLGHYTALDDTRNLAALNEILAQAEEVGRLRLELAELAPQADGLTAGLLGPRLAEIGTRLTVLGDPAGAAEAAALLARINTARTTLALAIAAAGALAACLVLYRRVHGLRRLPSPEARLQY